VLAYPANPLPKQSPKPLCGAPERSRGRPQHPAYWILRPGVRTRRLGLRGRPGDQGVRVGWRARRGRASIHQQFTDGSRAPSSGSQAGLTLVGMRLPSFRTCRAPTTGPTGAMGCRWIRRVIGTGVYSAEHRSRSLSGHDLGLPLMSSRSQSHSAESASRILRPLPQSLRRLGYQPPVRAPNVVITQSLGARLAAHQNYSSNRPMTAPPDVDPSTREVRGQWVAWSI